MIRTNLSTRPFYNEAAVHLWLLVFAALVIAASAYNVSRVVRYSRSDQRLALQASQDEQRATDLRQQAEQLRASVDPKAVELASNDARQANELIDRRTFSWTELLNTLETTLPDDVHVVAIRPRVEKQHGIVLTINVVAKTIEDTDKFIENLDATGAFRNLLSVEDRVNEQGLLESALQANYTPGAAKAKAPPQAETPQAEQPKVDEPPDGKDAPKPAPSTRPKEAPKP